MYWLEQIDKNIPEESTMGEADFVDSTVIFKLVEEVFSQKYSDIVDYINKVKVDLTFNQIQVYLSLRYATHNRNIHNMPYYVARYDQDTEIYHLNSDTLNYFRTMVDILKERCLKFNELIQLITFNQLDKAQNADWKELQKKLFQYDINIDANGYIYILDVKRLSEPFIENIKMLQETAEKANNLMTYSYFSIEKYLLQKDALSAECLYPSKELQVKNLNLDSQKGYIPLSNKQIAHLLEQSTNSSKVYTKFIDGIFGGENM